MASVQHFATLEALPAAESSAVEKLYTTFVDTLTLSQ